MTTAILVHPVLIRPLHEELMGTTALSPTQHKSILGAVLGIAVGIIVPFAAPAIATALNISATLAGALLGGALGAASSAITGGNILLGGLTGAIGGGISGFNAASPILGGSAGDFAGLSAAQLGGAGSGVAGSAGLTTSLGGSAGDFATTFGGDVLTGGVGDAALAGRIPDLGDTLSGFTDPGGVSDFQGVSFDDPGGVSDFAGLSPAQLGPSAPTAINPAAAPTVATAKPSVFDDFFSDGTVKRGLKEGGVKLATTGLSNLFGGDEADLTPAEIAARQQLATARANDDRLLAKKEAAADTFLTQAANISPLTEGQQRLTEEQNRLGRAQQAGLRNINPSNTGLRTRERRRNALDKSRLGGFSRGFNAARDRQIGLQSAGIRALPSGNADKRLQDINIAHSDFLRVQQQRKNANNIIEPLLQTAFLTKSDEELRKRRLEERP